jgi:hypothetical protein
VACSHASKKPKWLGGRYKGSGLLRWEVYS